VEKSTFVDQNINTKFFVPIVSFVDKKRLPEYQSVEKTRF